MLNQWTWMGGSSTGGGFTGSYGTIGVPAVTNVLGSREISNNMVIDSSNNMMIRPVRGLSSQGVDELWRPNAWLQCPKGETKLSPIENGCYLCAAGRYGNITGEGRPFCAGTITHIQPYNTNHYHPPSSFFLLHARS